MKKENEIPKKKAYPPSELKVTTLKVLLEKLKVIDIAPEEIQRFEIATII